MFDKDMQAALIADGAKLSELTGEDHGPYFLDDDDDVKCVNAHDRCYGGAGGPCPYCERPIVAGQQSAHRINVASYDDWFVEEE